MESIYEKFYEPLLRWCIGMAGNTSTGEDLAQETFLRAWQHLDELGDLSAGQQKSWLYKTAKNLYIDRIRKLTREVCAGDEKLEQSVFEQDFTGIAVSELVNRLPLPERELFILRYFQGYNATELGRMCDLPSSTVRSRLSSARQRLAEWLE